jgi:hypothetical protein
MLTESNRGDIFIRNLGQAQIISLTLTLSHRERELPLSTRQQSLTPTLF